MRSVNFYWKMITLTEKRMVKLFQENWHKLFVFFYHKLSGTMKAVIKKNFSMKILRQFLQIFIFPRGGTLFGNNCPRNVTFPWQMLYFHSPFDMHKIWLNWKVSCLSRIKMERNKNVVILYNFLQKQQFLFLKSTLIVLWKLSG